ncbi:MAG TPA: DUF4386 domain-containing protein [Gemmatimonadaceae bacterium]
MTAPFMSRDSSAVRADTIQAWARLAGALGLVSGVVGAFGEAYVPGLIMVAGDAAGTARNLAASEPLFRWGFAAYLVEALCDATLTIAFWVLVRPVSRGLAMGMVVFRIIATCGFAMSQVLWFGGLLTQRSGPAFSAVPAGLLDAQPYLLMQVAGFGGALFGMFYGVGNVLFGFLIHRSGYLPRILGVLMVITGATFTVRTFLLVLAPSFASPALVMTAALAFLPLSVWLLIKGVDLRAFRQSPA